MRVFSTGISDNVGPVIPAMVAICNAFNSAIYAFSGQLAGNLSTKIKVE
jgi:hypothetical protein